MDLKLYFLVLLLSRVAAGRACILSSTVGLFLVELSVMNEVFLKNTLGTQKDGRIY